jgi:tetratricopeptide (TPR) repeat protein
MNRYSPILVALLALLYVATSGFQCGSTEVTTARLAMQQQQWAKAEESLMKEVAKNDKNEEAWFLLGQVRLELKKYLPMNDAYTKALSISNEHKNEIERNRTAVWGTLYNEGIGLYNKGREDSANFTRAIEVFTTATALNPDSASTYYVLGLAHLAREDREKAIESFETALQRKPGYEEAARVLGQVYRARASEKKQAKEEAGAALDLEKSATAYEAAYNANPANPDNILSLIDVYEASNKNEKAMVLTRDAVAADPENRVFRYAYGVFLLKQDKFAESIEQLHKAVEPKPDEPDEVYADAVYNLGVAYLNWGVAMKAEADKRAENEKKGVKVKEDLSYKEKFKAALPYMEESSKLRSDDAGLWQYLGRLYANLNMVKESREAFEKSDSLMKNK